MRSTGKKSKVSVVGQKADDLIKKKSSKTGSQVYEDRREKTVHKSDISGKETELTGKDFMRSGSVKQDTYKKYSEPDDFAASACFTLSKEGKIIEVNLWGSQILGEERPLLKNRPFDFFVSDDTKPIFNLFLGKIFSNKTMELCEVTLVTESRFPIYVYLVGIATENREQCFVTMVAITERKQTEEALHVSLTKYRALFDSFPVGITVSDSVGKIIETNLIAEQLLGISRTEQCQRQIHGAEWQIVRTDGTPMPASEYASVRALREKRRVENMEMGIVKSKDQVTWINVSAVPVPLEGYGVAIVYNDITDSKRAENALRESEDRYRGLITNINAGVVVHAPDTSVIQNNPKASELLGLSEEQIKGKLSIDPQWKFLNENYTPLPLEEYPVNQILTSKTSLINQVFGVMRPATNDIVWLIVNGFPVLDNNGEIYEIVISFIDITKLKQAEKDLKQLNEDLEDRIIERTGELLIANDNLEQNKEKYRIVADFTYDWEYWVNPEGYFVYVSPSCKRITGYTAEEFVNDNDLLFKIIHPDDSKDFSSHFTHQLNTKEGCEIEFRIITKEGHERWIGHACQPVFGNNGEYLGKRGSNRDITGKVKAENELLKITVETEERERNQFSRELHDGLGPLLSTIKLYFQWLAETDDPEKRKIITEKGNYSIERAIQTTHEVAHGLNSQHLDKYGYVDSVIDFTQRINDTKKLKIDFTFNARKRFSNFLEITLFRITTELINNTLNYANAYHVSIEFDHNSEKRIITFTYIDNGIGFDLADVEKAKKGLGLMNIQQRIKRLNGKLGIETGIGKGMKVYIELPVQENINRIE